MANITGTGSPEILQGTINADSILGLGGDDVLYGYDGNDTLDGGLGDDFLYAGSGNDLLIGGAGEDFYYGGSGTDKVSFSAAAAGLRLNLIDPFDSTGDAAGDFFFSIESFALTKFDDSFLGSTRGDSVTGGDGLDTLDGGAGADSLKGEAGNDLLIGGAGADTLDGAGGTDTASYSTATAALSMNLDTGVLSGDAAGDVFVGIEQLVLSNLNDQATLGGTWHKIDGGAGDDVILGSSAADTIAGGFGADTLTGGGGNDSLTAGNDSNPADANAEANLLSGGLGNDTLSGGSAVDTLNGEDGADSLLGAGGADVLSGGTGNDTLRGGDQDDRMTGGAGADSLDGGSGSDTVIYDTPVTLDLGSPSASTGDAKGDTLTGIEVIEFAGAGANVFKGSARAVEVQGDADLTFVAGTGAETVIGVGKVDYSGMTSSVTLTLGAGNNLTGSGAAAGDVIDSNPGISATVADITLTGSNDTLDLRLGAGNLVSLGSVSMGNGTDTVLLGDIVPVNIASLDMGSGNDTVSGKTQAGVFILGDGADSLNLTAAGQGTITVAGGVGSDSITASGFVLIALDAGDGNDTINADATIGSFTGGSGADVMNITVDAIESGVFLVDGGTGNDVITLTGNVTGSVAAIRTISVTGGEGNDTINGLSIDDLTAEKFVFALGWGNDVVTGFDAGDDHIVFSGTASGGLDQVADLTVTGNASHTVLTFGTDQIDIQGLNVASFTADMILFV